MLAIVKSGIYTLSTIDLQKYDRIVQSGLCDQSSTKGTCRIEYSRVKSFVQSSANNAQTLTVPSIRYMTPFDAYYQSMVYMYKQFSEEGRSMKN